MNNDDRISYYLGNLIKKKYVNIESDNYDTDLNKSNTILKVNVDNILQVSNGLYYDTYLEPIININGIEKYKKNTFLYRIGDTRDILSTKYVISKTRNINDYNTILLKLSIPRHWGYIPFILKNDIPFNNKQDELLWIGSTTGYDENSTRSRFNLVTTYFKKNKQIKVGFSYPIVQGKHKYKKYIIPNIDQLEQLKYKYLLSVEGNDVASDLKWKMASNSIVLMCKPTVVSWFMEDILIPGYHYVLLKDDYSDVEQKLEWCIQNAHKCKEIIENASKYVSVFLNEENEQIVQHKVIEQYFKRCKFNTD